MVESNREPAIYLLLLLFLCLLLAGCSNASWKRISSAVIAEPGTDRPQKKEPTGKRDIMKPGSLTVKPLTVKPAGTVTLLFSYKIIKDKAAIFQALEEVTIRGRGITTVLLKRRVNGKEGMHTSVLEITMPKDISAGTYTIMARVKMAGLETKATTRLQVVETGSN